MHLRDHHFAFLVSLLFCGLTVLVAASIVDHHATSSEANEEGGRAEWEVKRLRDPATGTIPAGIRQRELAFAATLPSNSERLFARGRGSAIDWMQRGPFNIGGRTRAFGLDIRGEDTVLAGGVSGGMWRSTDRGMSWSMTTLPNQLPAVSSLAQDTRLGHEDTWYAGTGELTGASQSADGAYYLGDGVFKSTDNGRSWAQIPSTVSGTPHSYDKSTDLIWSVVTDPSSPDTSEVYVATAGAILRSVDGGNTWRSVLISSPSAYYCDLAISQTGVVYATFSWIGFGSTGAGRRGVYRSVDGLKWTFIGPSFLPDSTRRIVAAIAPSNERVLYFAAETPHAGKLGRNFQGDSVWGSIWKYTYDSGDGSGTGGGWEDLSANVPSFGGSFGDFNPQFSYDLHIAVDPRDEDVVVLGGTNLYRTTNGFRDASGSAWIGGYRNIPFTNEVIVPLSYPEHHSDQHRALFSRRDSTVLFTASDGGVHYTGNFRDDTVQWQSLNRGYFTTQFYTVAYDRDHAGRMLLMGGMQDNGTWSTYDVDNSAPWVQRGSGDGSYCAIVDSGRTLYVSKQQGKTYRVDLDEQGTMSSFARIDPVGASGYQFINPFVPDPRQPHRIYMLGGTRVWRNDDVMAIPNGTVDSVSTNWTSLDGTNGGSPLSAIAITTDNPGDRVWYANDSGRVYRIDGASGPSPAVTNKTSSSFPAGGYVSCIAVDPDDGDRAVVVFSNYNVMSLFYTEDAGATWTPVAGNLEQNPNGSGNGPSLRWFAFAPQAGGSYFLVGASTGLYSTTRLDGMSTVWTQEGAATIGNVPVDMISIASDRYNVAIGTHGRGVFTGTLPTLGVDGYTNRTRAGSMTITPNPARGTTAVAWELAERIPAARVSVYDLLGRAVLRKELGPTVDRTGERELTLLDANGKRLAAGLYFVRMEWATGSMTRELRIE